MRLGKDIGGNSGYEVDPENLLYSRQLIPSASYRPQPAYIPAPIIEDYEEACKIVDLSPKAAATLARRCLQGMIRDFCQISRRRLIDEINALRDAVNDGTADRAVTSESVDAIDHVRAIGNIGAHMEADINLIVPVDSGESRILIDLIEMLFSEWYIARHNRQQRLASLASIAASKKAQPQEAIGAATLLLGDGT